MTRQLFLPGFPDGVQKIGKGVGILEKDGQVTYLVGADNYFSHPSAEAAGRRFALTSLMENGYVKACELERGLGIPHRTLMNWLGQCRTSGPGSFYRQATPMKPRIMTADKGAECARLLAEGNTLTIRIHRMANPVHDRAIAALLEELNSQEFAHPETGAKMTFALV
jgi:hypothetical protein